MVQQLEPPTDDGIFGTDARRVTPLLVPIAPTDPFYARAKRITDIMLSALALIVLAPVFLVVALAIFFTSGWPVIYKQTRLGLGGRPFTLYKFRTMVRDAESRLLADPELLQEFKLSWKLPNDNRITPIGAILRKTSVDELPQLLNILTGDMTLVGPRPVQITEAYDVYGDNVAKLLSVPPGLTGLWQVSGRSDLHNQDRVDLDMAYAKTRSIWLDLQIIARTIPAVLRRQGAK